MTGQQGITGDLVQLYRDAIKRHSADPVGYRQPIEATHRHEEYNPLCGDRIEIALRVENANIEAAAFDGEACAICMASASLLCSLAPGRTVEALVQLGEDLHDVLDTTVGAASAVMELEGNPGTESPPMPPVHEELQPLLGVRPYPSRIRCATLPWTAASRALAG